MRTTGQNNLLSILGILLVEKFPSRRQQQRLEEPRDGTGRREKIQVPPRRVSPGLEGPPSHGDAWTGSIYRDAICCRSVARNDVSCYDIPSRRLLGIENRDRPGFLEPVAGPRRKEALFRERRDTVRIEGRLLGCAGLAGRSESRCAQCQIETRKPSV